MTCPARHSAWGKFAGHNAAASLLDVAPYPYRQVNYVTCLDLGGWGAVYSEGWDQKVKSVRDDAKKIKIAITNELIYPPAADRAVALPPPIRWRNCLAFAYRDPPERIFFRLAPAR